MRYVAPNSRKWLSLLALLCWSRLASAQTANTANTPPTLRDGVAWQAKLRLVYREVSNHTSIITARFRVNPAGNLDSLEVDGGPDVQKDSLRSQLTRLNGKWKPQTRNGKPVLSKWMCFRWYISGFYDDAAVCKWAIGDERKAAYEREASLFQCTAAWNKPLTCRTYFIEGTDYFWFPPFHSVTNR